MVTALPRHLDARPRLNRLAKRLFLPRLKLGGVLAILSNHDRESLRQGLRYFDGAAILILVRLWSLIEMFELRTRQVGLLNNDVVLLINRSDLGQAYVDDLGPTILSALWVGLFSWRGALDVGRTTVLNLLYRGLP